MTLHVELPTMRRERRLSGSSFEAALGKRMASVRRNETIFRIWSWPQFLNFPWFCRKLVDSWRKRSRNRSLDEAKPPEVVWRSNSEDNMSVVGRKPQQSEKKVCIKFGGIRKSNGKGSMEGFAMNKSVCHVMGKHISYGTRPTFACAMVTHECGPTR